MSALFDYLWPSIGVGAVIGAIAGSFVLRRKLALGQRFLWLAAAFAIAFAGSLLWSGPLGGADRFIARVERDARLALDHYEMTEVGARLARAPLSRTLMLKGPADDLQTVELVRLMSTLPGVGEARWSPVARPRPLFAEGGLAALAGFLVGLFLAHLLELHRRYNAQWNW